MLTISVGEVRRWEQGIRPPGTARCVELGKICGPPDCWFWWELAGVSKSEIRRALGVGPGPAEKDKDRRFSEETIMEYHTALDLIFDNAPSEIIKKVQALLEKHAAQWREQ